MAKIGLVHVDGKLPNLALMKISAWHKARGNEVVLYRSAEDYLNGIDLFNQCDYVYGAIVFTENKHKAIRLLKAGVMIGGTGWSLKDKLPDEVEQMIPDYDLYDIDYGIGFTHRGCIRRCPFCMVWQKEPSMQEVAMPISLLNPKSNKLVLLDNNFLASPNWREKAQQIIDNKIQIDFTQGLDIRLVTEEAAKLLKAMRHAKRLHFAFDSLSIQDKVRTGIERLLKVGFHPDKLSFFVLTNYETSFKEDKKRIDILLSYGVNPFVMIYNRKNAPQKIRDLGRWCNRPALRKSCSFEDYSKPVTNVTVKCDNMLV